MSSVSTLGAKECGTMLAAVTLATIDLAAIVILWQLWFCDPTETLEDPGLRTVYLCMGMTDS